MKTEEMVIGCEVCRHSQTLQDVLDSDRKCNFCTTKFVTIKMTINEVINLLERAKK